LTFFEKHKRTLIISYIGLVLFTYGFELNSLYFLDNPKLFFQLYEIKNILKFIILVIPLSVVSISFRPIIRNLFQGMSIKNNLKTVGTALLVSFIIMFLNVALTFYSVKVISETIGINNFNQFHL